MYNVGTKADGEFEDIKGTAEAPNPAAPAALLVTFPIGEWWSDFSLVRVNPARVGGKNSCVFLWQL